MHYYEVVEREEEEGGVGWRGGGGGCSLQRLTSYMQYMVYEVAAILLVGSSYSSQATESGLHV